MNSPAPGPPAPQDARRRLTLALINQLGYPGVGTIMAGRAIGYAQAALMTVGLALTLLYLYRVAQELMPFMLQSRTPTQEEIRHVYTHHLVLGRLGLVASLAAWLWSLVSSIAILNPRPAQPPPEDDAHADTNT